MPPERLLILDLQKGFGFEEICKYLNCPVPDAEWPKSNALSEFTVAAEMILAPSVKKTKVIVSAVAVGLSATVLLFFFPGALNLKHLRSLRR